jgi:hypothetical protein
VSAHDETAFVLGMWAMDEFKNAAAEAVAAMDETERALCAGLAEMVAAGGERPLNVPGKPPYYLVTTAGLHVGVLLKKGGIFSRGEAKNVFIPSSAIRRTNTDHQSATDLLNDAGRQVAFVKFSDIFSRQFVRDRNDAAPPHAGHHGEYSAYGQLQNFARALGVSL